MDSPTANFHGLYRDILLGPNGQLLDDRGWQRNTIVDSCRVLLAGFITNDTNTPTAGIQYLAVGRGLESWDSEGAPASDPTTTLGLQDPSPVQIPITELDVDYLDTNDEIVAQPTPRIQIKVTLAAGFPPPVSPAQSYPLREFGLFGRFNNNDFMINSIRHPVIRKDINASLIRLVRLYF